MSSLVYSNKPRVIWHAIRRTSASTAIALSSSKDATPFFFIRFFIITVAAAEAAVGLGILIAFFRNRDTVNADEIDLLKW